MSRAARRFLSYVGGASQTKRYELPHLSAFNFLEHCHESRIDMTSAGSISEAPQHVLSSFDSSSRSYKQLKGLGANKLALEQCGKFFRRRGIICGTENITLNERILSGISLVYDTLKIKKILIPTPTFDYYLKQLQIKNIQFETVPTRKEDGFLLDPKKLDAAIKRSGAKLLLLCYPNNPTGVVMTEENAHAIADIVKKNDIFVISDEAFVSNIINPDKKHFSIAAVDGMLDRSVTFTSMSKSMGLPFIRASFCVGPQDIIKGLASLGGITPGFEEIMIKSMMDSEENLSYLEDNRQKYLFNIELIKEKIEQLNKKFCEVFGEEKSGKESYVKAYIPDPESCNVYLLDFSGLRNKIYKDKKMKTGLDVAEWLLNGAGVGTVPGECFLFNPDEMLVRIALSHPPHEIEQAFNYMEEAAKEIQNSIIELPSSSPTPKQMDSAILKPEELDGERTH